MIFEPLSRDLVESREIPARRGQRVPVARRRASARNLERLRVGSWAGGHGRIREWGQAFDYMIKHDIPALMFWLMSVNR